MAEGHFVAAPLLRAGESLVVVAYDVGWPLLFCDFLRCHPRHAEEYAALKLGLIERQYGLDSQDYTEAKAPLIWTIIRQASDWSQEVGWEPGPSDA